MPPGREASVPGWHDHCRSALPSRPIGRKQQSFWPGSIFRSRLPHEHSVHGEGLNQVRRNRRLGVRSLRGRQTRRCCVHEKLLPLPREGQSKRSRFYSLCTLTESRDRIWRQTGHSLVFLSSQWREDSEVRQVCLHICLTPRLHFRHLGLPADSSRTDAAHLRYA